MRTSARGLSPAVTVALLILVTIAIVAGIYYWLTSFTRPTDVVQVQANLIQNKWGSDFQVAVIELRVIPKTNKQLTIQSITARVTYKDGTVDTVTVDLSTKNEDTGPDKGTVMTVDGQRRLIPGSTSALTVVLKQTDLSTNGAMTSVVFTITVADPSGNTYTYTSNEVPLT